MTKERPVNLNSWLTQSREALKGWGSRGGTLRVSRRGSGHVHGGGGKFWLRLGFRAGVAFLWLGTRECPHSAVFLVARFEEFGGFQFEQLFEVFENGLLQRGGRCVVILVCTAERFGNYFVHDAQFQQIRGGELEGLGVVDEVIPEPLGGAHKDYDTTAAALKK